MVTVDEYVALANKASLPSKYHVWYYLILAVIRLLKDYLDLALLDRRAKS